TSVRWRLRRRDRRALAQLGAALAAVILAVGGGVAAWWTRDALAVEVARAPAVLDACGPLLLDAPGEALRDAIPGEHAGERAAVEAYLRGCAAALEGERASATVQGDLSALAAALSAAGRDGPATGAALTLREAGPAARSALERLLRRVALAHGLTLELPTGPSGAAL